MLSYHTLFTQTKNLSVLLCEDYLSLREDLAELLQDLFQNVYVAENGYEALEIYKNAYGEVDSGIDVVITDIQMPKMNGVELCEAIRKMNASQSIIVLSAHADREYLIELINFGISKFIDKPIDQDKFMHILHDVSSRRNMEKKSADNRDVICFDEGYSWNKKNHELLKEDQPIELTQYEYILLKILFERSGAICTYLDIIQYFYDLGIDLNEKNIRKIIFKLRKKLPDDFIQSIYSMGYKVPSLW
jgi:DNA-binding response OmpR family regulator